jgi:hypothetical protein
MRASALKYTILSWSSNLVLVIMLLVPFHAFLTVWGASLIGHYTALRLWKEVLLLICGVGVLYLWVADHKIRTHTLSRRVVWLVLAYVALTVAFGLIALIGGELTHTAFGYGLIVNLRYPIFFLIAWSLALRIGRLQANWRWVILVPATAVAVFGLIQVFLLPHDFLRHFGYSEQTIPAFETINNNQHYVRIASTLRGANPLGAYLIIPISAVVVWLVTVRRNRWYMALLAALLCTLFFSFSRSAWIGTAIAIGTILAATQFSSMVRQRMAIGMAVAVLLTAGAALALRHNARFQNIFLHTETHSSVRTSSNEGHVSALRGGLKEIAREPLGQGPGSAGPASVYNGKHGVRIAENYYVQIAREVGWLGLGLFLMLNVGVGLLLWHRRADPLALALFASLLGLSFVNLLSHAWGDDTIAYLWWGMAGIAMASLPKSGTEDE